MHSLIRKLKKQGGFTLIELMIVVAIIGILAAIAIPNFLKFQLRSKASEGKINLAGIRTAQESYFAEVGSYQAWTDVPASLPMQNKAAFGVVCSIPPVVGTDPGFCFIGWQPEGDMYYQYAVTVGVTNPTSFFAEGQSDIDADGNLNHWGIMKPNLAGNLDGAVATWSCGNVVNPNDSQPMMSQVGPCDNTDMARNVF